MQEKEENQGKETFSAMSNFEGSLGLTVCSRQLLLGPFIIFSLQFSSFLTSLNIPSLASFITCPYLNWPGLTIF